MWMRYAAFAAPVLLVAAITVAIVLTSDAGPQPTTAASVAQQPGGDLAEAPPPEPQATASPTPPCENGTAVAGPATNPGLVGDCEALLAAKDTLRGTETLNWSADLAIGSWEGITTGGTPSRVTKLEIDGWNSQSDLGREIVLTGTIPPELGGLSNLQRLTLSRNELTGTIPAKLGNLAELTTLQLHGNRLTGGIPPELGNLSSLDTLNLRDNALGGSIPVELGKLSNLAALYLESSQLTGSIPAALGELSELVILQLDGNTMLSGCIPASLRDITISDLGSLDLEYCTTTTTYTLTTEAGEGGRISPLPGTHTYLDGVRVTATATPDDGWRIASWGGDCSGTASTATSCPLTLSANRTASVTFERITHGLTVTVSGEGGSVTPPGATTHDEGAEVTLTASWSDATHSFTGWGGDCAGTTSTCELTMDAAKTVTATFAALPATRCATTTASDCIRAVYRGAPDDYAQVADVPAGALLTPGSDGRYRVERGQQYTVVTAAPLPVGWTRFYLERSPLEFGTPSPVSDSQLIKPVGTTYTFTVTEDEAASTLITFDLKQARPFVRPRPDGKPEIGATVVTTKFLVETTTFSYDTFDSTGAVAAAGSYALLMPDDDSDDEDATTAVTTYEQLRTESTVMRVNVQDKHGASWASFYDTIAVGDAVEWHEANDCWVRYQVTEVPVPELDAAGRDFGVEWATYADTGCAGTVSTDTASRIAWVPLPITSRRIDAPSRVATTPIRHGAYRLYPTPWSGAAEEQALSVPDYRSRVGDTDDESAAMPSWPSDVIAEVRQHPLWSDPVIPEGWELVRATAYSHYWVAGWYWTGTSTLVIHSQMRPYHPIPDTMPRRSPMSDKYNNIYEMRTINGLPVVIWHDPRAANRVGEQVRVYDKDTAIERIVTTYSGNNVDRTIAIALSLFSRSAP